MDKKRLVSELKKINKALLVINNSLKNVITILEEDMEPTDNLNSLDNFLTQENVLLEKVNEVEMFLESKGLNVISYCNGVENVPTLKIAKFIGERYKYLSEFIKKLKASAVSGYPIEMILRNFPEEKISSICQLAKSLYDIAFLSEYKYLKSPKYILHARVNRDGKVINFLTGKWLEYFVVTKVINILSGLGIKDFSYMSNIRFESSDGKKGELDVVFKVGNEVFWFEAKTGEYQNYITKYKNFRKILGLKPENAFLVITDITEENAKFLSSVFEMTVVSLEMLDEKFSDIINKKMKGKSLENKNSNRSFSASNNL